MAKNSSSTSNLISGSLRKEKYRTAKSITMSDYESDDAPEAVDFKTSKSKALDEAKAANEAAKLKKLKRAEARKKRQELFE